MSALRKSVSDRIFDIINITVMILIILIMLYPLYYTVIASLSDPAQLALGRAFIKPAGFTTEAYANAFKESRIWVGYRNSIIYTVTGTLLSLIITIPAGYVMSKKNLPGRNMFTIYFLVTMYIGGGLIPTYILVDSLGLIDTPYILIILGSFSVFNMIITRVYFQTSVPNELYESAYIDGASDYRCFFQIALPLVKPIVAVMALFYGVGHWNQFFEALIYISKAQYQPLQLVLRNILLLNQTATAELNTATMDSATVKELMRQAYMAEAMKYALIFIASAPMLIAYPFVQKYFVKGVMIGSLKG